MVRRLPPLSALRPFEAAARLESFSRAAEELHLTHGAVSHQVRALEEHLGAPLFARYGKRVALTAAGREFAERVRSALDEIAQAAEQVKPARRDHRLTVSVLPSFATGWLMPRLIRFMEAHPKIEVNILATNTLADFERDEVDVAIRFGRGPWPPLACEMFLEDEFFPVASARTKTPRSPRDLLDLRLIREDRHYWPEWFAAAGVTVDRPIEGPTFNDASYSMQAAARGEGIALARRSIVMDEIVGGRLKRLFAVGFPAPERYWFVSPRALAGAARVKAFRDWVRAELASG